MALLSLVAALGTITGILTAHANEQGAHGVEPGVMILLAVAKRIFYYLSPVLVGDGSNCAVVFYVVDIGDHHSLDVENVVSTDGNAQDGHYERSKTTDKREDLVEGLRGIPEHSDRGIDTQQHSTNDVVRQSRSLVSGNWLNICRQIRVGKSEEAHLL